MYVSIDLETLGTDPETCDVIEFGAVIDNLEDDIDKLPRYHCYLPKDLYRGQPFAMAMHSKILHRIAVREKGYTYMPPEILGEDFRRWLKNNGIEIDPCYGPAEIVVAGKNFSGFDRDFLRLIPNFTDHISVFRRVLDPVSSFYSPKTDDKPPSLEECLKRAGIDKTVSHNAIDDALDVIKCMRYIYRIPLFRA